MKAKKPRVVCARFFEYIGPDLNAGQNNQTLIALIQVYKKFFWSTLDWIESSLKFLWIIVIFLNV